LTTDLESRLLGRIESTSSTFDKRIEELQKVYKEFEKEIKADFNSQKQSCS
jgi:hypothetical protein